MALKVPDYLIPALAKLLRFEEGPLNALVSALREAEPTLDLEELASQVSTKTNLDKASVHEIIRLLVGLYATYTNLGQSAESVVSNLRQGFRRIEKSEISAEDAGWAHVEKFLVNSLTLDHVIGAAAKAFDVMTAYEHIYLDARVLTDLRPIFKPDVDEAPGAAVIIHLMRIQYQESGDQNKEMFFALDGLDLVSLKKTLDRALSKEKSLKAAAANANIKCLSRKEK